MRTISKVAKEANVGIETIRFYERQGLLKQPRKTGTFREYDQDHALRVRFIKRAQELGFTLKEIKGLLSMNSNPKALCEDLQQLASAKLREIELKIADLQKMKAAVKLVEKACGQSPKAAACCRIIDCFEGNC